jgi:hypothetical protein
MEAEEDPYLSGPMPVPLRGRLRRFWRPQAGPNADVLGPASRVACPVRGRFGRAGRPNSI